MAKSTRSIQLYRSSITTRRPAGAAAPVANQLNTGEMYLNMADLQLGFIDAVKNPQDLIPITNFSAAADYATGALVVQGGRLLRANKNITAKVFDSGDWLSLESAMPLFDPTATYVQGDQVIQSGKLYTANINIVAPAAFNPLEWDQPLLPNPPAGVNQVITASQPADMPLKLKGAAGQVANIFQVDSSSGGMLAQVNKDGAMACVGDITAFFSDMRLKTYISPIVNSLDKVRTLEGFIYVPNPEAIQAGAVPADDTEVRVGVSAQAVQAVLPEAVSPAPFDLDNQSGENYLTVDYGKLVPLLIESIKELANRVEQLESEQA